MITHVAGTYVPISRDELEDWLNTIGFRGRWNLDPRSAGVYIVHLSETVGVKLSSTIGSRDDAMGRGQASMQLALVSRVTGRVLNKKDQGQSHFKRTIGWKKTWEAGIQRMKAVYVGSMDFYDAIAAIEDRERYRADLMKRIEDIPGWKANDVLTRLYRKADTSGVFMPRDMEALADAEGVAREAAKPKPEPVKRMDPAIMAIRSLYRAAKNAGDDWTLDFATALGQRMTRDIPLTAPQVKVLKDKLRSYNVQTETGASAETLF